MGDLRFTQVKVYTHPSVSIHSIGRAPLAGLEICVPVCANLIQYPVFFTTGSYLGEHKIWGIFKMREILYQSSSLSAFQFCAYLENFALLKMHHIQAALGGYALNYIIPIQNGILSFVIYYCAGWPYFKMVLI